MPRHPCSFDGERTREKLATLYFAWYTEAGARISYKCWSCIGCLTERYAPILRNSNSTSTESDTCLGCGGTLEKDSEPVYLILYLPKQERRDYELAFDAQCADKIREDIRGFGERQDSRSDPRPSSGAPELDPWDGLEL